MRHWSRWFCVLAWTLTRLIASADAVSGSVSDPSGLPVVEARIAVRDEAGRLLRELRSGAGGRFRIENLAAGRYQLVAGAAGFRSTRVAFDFRGGAAPRLDVRLELEGLATQITVTATRGSVEDVDTSPRLVSVGGPEVMRGPAAGLGAALQDKPGVLVQETTFGAASPFLRGLTGYQTLFLVDGIRFNTSIFRSGPNQYLSLIDAAAIERVEATLGPGSAAYGSDSLGGTIQMLTPQHRFGSGRLAAHGEAGVYGGSADVSGAGRAQVALSNAKLWWSLAGSAARHNDLRPGAGADSHNVFRRYFGLSAGQVRALLGGRLQDTAFAEHGVHTKLAFRPAANQTLSGWYQRTGLDGLRSYRDQLGGLGRLQSAFDPQFGQFAYVRYEKLRTGPLDTLAGTLSLNWQADGAVRQAMRFSDPIAREDNRVRAAGYSVQASTHAGLHHMQLFGAELYSERIRSTRFEDHPATLARTQTRAVFPNGARYRTAAVFFQDMSELAGGKLRATAGLRLTGVRFRSFADANLDAAGRPLGVADSTQSFRDVTFDSSLAYRPVRVVALHAVVGRGFRAPNVSDLGRIGFTGGTGYEIPNDLAASHGALMGDTNGEGARWTGKPVGRLGAETLTSYQAGATLHSNRLLVRLQAFDAELSNPIVARTILFPAEQAPSSIAGLEVTVIPPTPEEQAQGVVSVAPAGIDPRSIKTAVNDGRSRYYGIESVFRYEFSSRWSAHANYSWLHGRDLDPNRPVRRLPPQQAGLSVRHTPSGRRPWFVVSAAISGAQERLSAGDIDDERIGASRRRVDIASFFQSAIVSPYLVRDGPSVRFGPTGETLAEIRDRVLPIGAVRNGVRITSDNTRVPLYTRTPGWVVLGVRTGIPVRDNCSLSFGVENLLDRNYRGHGSGVDGAGRSAFAGVEFRF